MPTDSSSLSEEVASEIEVLNAIYEDDFLPRPPVWNLPSFAIRVQPTINEGERGSKVIVRFKLNSGYPDKPCTVEIEEHEGLSKEDVSLLTKEILSNCKNWAGSPMCHEVVVFVKKFLEDKIEKNVSLYDSMVDRIQSEKKYIDSIRGRETNVEDADLTQTVGYRAPPKPAAPPTIPSAAKTSSNTASLNALKAQSTMQQQHQAKAATSGKKEPAAAKQPNAAPSPAPIPAPAPPAVAAPSASNKPHDGIATMTDDNAKTTEAAPSKAPAIAVPAKPRNPLPYVLEEESEMLYHDSMPIQSSSLLDDEDEDEEDVYETIQGDEAAHSRYIQEFDQLEKLGGGASGTVWKVRNKLDEGIYAVKKIVLKEQDASYIQIQREVTTISKLMHKYIVRYYAAWMEEVKVVQKVKSVKKVIEENSLNSNLDLKKLEAELGDISLRKVVSYSDNIYFDYEEDDGDAAKAVYIEGSESESESDSENSDSDSDSDDSDSSSNSSDDSGSQSTASSSEEDSSADSSAANDESNSGSDYIVPPRRGRKSPSSSAAGHQKLKTIKSEDEVDGDGEVTHVSRNKHLFIQMEYCPSTLRDYIDQGELHKQPQEIMRLLRQLLEGLAYIHGKKVIHRDLKPANIFLDSEMQVKLGDFGLATSSTARTSASVTDLTTLDQPSSPSKESHSHRRAAAHAEMSHQSDYRSLTAGIGTALYRAPELETITSKSLDPRDNSPIYTSLYNEKIDIYSLGIILFELCHRPFTATLSERIRTINELRNSCKLPSSFPQDPAYDNLKEIILLCIQPVPSTRPTANALLNSPLVPPRADIDSSYLREITAAVYRPNSTAAIDVLSILFGLPSSMVKEGRRVGFDDEILKRLAENVRGRYHSLTAPAPANTAVPANPIRRIWPSPSPVLTAPPSTKKVILQTAAYTTYLRHLLTGIFSQHNATQFSSLPWTLHSLPPPSSNTPNVSSSSSSLVTSLYRHYASLYPDWEEVRYLDEVGQVVVPRMDLVTSFIRFLAYFFTYYSSSSSLSSSGDANTSTGTMTAASGNMSSSAAAGAGAISSAIIRSDIDHVQISPGRHEVNALKSNYEEHKRHPSTALQAVYDIILPLSNGSETRLFAESEVLSVCYQLYSSLQPLLPDYELVLRVGHTDLPYLLTRLFFWEVDRTPSTSTEAASQAFTAARYGHLGNLWNAKIEALTQRLKPLFVQVTECNSAEEMDILLTSAFNAPSPFSAVDGQPLLPLQRQRIISILSIFYTKRMGTSNDILTALAALESAFYATDIFKQGAPAGSGPGSSGNSNSTPASSAAVSAAPPTAPAAKKAPDFSPIDVHLIGVKTVPPKRRKSGGTEPAPAPSTALQPPTPPTPAPASSAAPSNSAQSQEDALRSLSQAFDAIIAHLSGILRLHLQACKPNASYAVLDVGVDGIALPHGYSPYTTPGPRYLLEAYLPQRNVHASTAPSGSAVSSFNAGASSTRRRFRKPAGVLLDGGHYEATLRGQKRVFNKLDVSHHQPNSVRNLSMNAKGMSGDGVVALGCMVYVENIVQLLVRQEARGATPLLTHLRSSFTGLSVSSVPQVLVVASIRGRAVVTPSPLLCTPSIARALHQLRERGISASTHIHGLQGGIDGVHVTHLCRQLGVTALVILERDADDDKKIAAGSKEVLDGEAIVQFLRSIDGPGPALRQNVPLTDVAEVIVSALTSATLPVATSNMGNPSAPSAPSGTPSITALASSSAATTSVEPAQVFVAVLCTSRALGLEEGGGSSGGGAASGGGGGGENSGGSLWKRRRRELSAIDFRITIALQRLYSLPSTQSIRIVSEDAMPTATTEAGITTSSPAASARRVFVVDLPFALLRSVNTLWSTAAANASSALSSSGVAGSAGTSNSTSGGGAGGGVGGLKESWREELDRLPCSSLQRKVVKALLHDVARYADEVVHQTLGTSAANLLAGSAVTKKGSGGGGSAGSTGSAKRQAAASSAAAVTASSALTMQGAEAVVVTALTYSSIDHLLDIVSAPAVATATKLRF